MRFVWRPSEIAPRLSAGAFIFNSGLTKRTASTETAAWVHGSAAGTYPFLKHLEPEQFTRVLSTTEIVLGAALMNPLVPTRLAGAALTGFAGGLFGLYWRTPGMRQPGSLRPTDQGVALAKDVWLLGIGVGLLAGGRRKRRGSSAEASRPSAGC